MTTGMWFFTPARKACCRTGDKLPTLHNSNSLREKGEGGREAAGFTRCTATDYKPVWATIIRLLKYEGSRVGM